MTERSEIVRTGVRAELAGMRGARPVPRVRFERSFTMPRVVLIASLAIYLVATLYQLNVFPRVGEDEPWIRRRAVARDRRAARLGSLPAGPTLSSSG